MWICGHVCSLRVFVLCSSPDDASPIRRYVTILITIHANNIQGNARLKTYERACEVRDAYEKMAEGSEETPSETKEERAERKRIKKVLVRSKKVSKLLKPLEATAPTDEVTESKEEEGELA